MSSNLLHRGVLNGAVNMTDSDTSSSSGPEGQKPPPPAEQVAVFAAAAVLSGFVMFVGQRSLLPELAKSRADMGEVLTILPILMSLVAAGIWIGIYSIFSAVPVKPAIPFMWAVGGLYVAAEILLLSQALALVGMQPPIGYYISITGGMVVLILIFQHWFRKKGRIPEKQ